jgi:hypothetical protein
MEDPVESGGDDPGQVVDGAELAGDLSENATYTGTIRLTADATVLPGVSITIAPGSQLVASSGVALVVRGTLVVDGAADDAVSMAPQEGAPGWVGVRVEQGGSATIRHATGTKVAVLMDCRAGAATCALEDIDFEGIGKVLSAAATATLSRARGVDLSNGAVYVQGGGDVAVRDSELMASSGDVVVASGGRLLVEYSSIGGTVDTYEHCNVHVGGAESVVIRYSNIVTGTYGIMIGGTAGALINYNNFQGNGAGNDVDPVGTVTAADFRYNYWDQGAPIGLGAEYDFSSPASAPVADAGPRG